MTTSDDGNATRYGRAQAGESALRMAMQTALRKDPHKFDTRIHISPEMRRADLIEQNLAAGAIAFVVGALLAVALPFFTSFVQSLGDGLREHGIIVNLLTLLLSLVLLVVALAIGLIALYLMFVVAPVLALRGLFVSKSAKYGVITDESKLRDQMPRVAGGDLNDVDPGAESWARGAHGEHVVGRLLESLPAGHQVAHDIEVLDASGRVRANIDHLVTGPAGIWVVDSKHWQGETRPDGLGGIDGHEYKHKAPETVRWEAGHVQTGVSGIIIAVVGGTVEGDGFILRGNPDVIVMVADRVPALLELRASKSGRNLMSMRMIDRVSPQLRFR